MQRSNVSSASAVIGQSVRNSTGEILGKIEDIIIDPETAGLNYAILSYPEFPGKADRLVAIPWESLTVSPLQDFVVLNSDRKTLDRAPGWSRTNPPNMADPAWQTGIHQYYGRTRSAAPGHSVRERTVYVEKEVRVPKKQRSVLAGALLVCLLVVIFGVTFLLSSRGWDQTREDVKSSLQGAAYAMKESSQEATLTAKVKTALSLSKRVPASQINVDSEDDVVTLRGEVPSEEIRALAESIARETPGVRLVRNHLYAISQSSATP